MSQHSPIQWCDDSINPTMGCSVQCELRPAPNQLVTTAATFFAEKFPHVTTAHVEEVVSNRLQGLTATEIFLWRHEIVRDVFRVLDAGGHPFERFKIGDEFEAELKARIICYAHQRHLRYSSDVTRPEKKAAPGYAPRFEEPTKFPGRMAAAAEWPDLFGTIRKSKPWLDYLPRLVFVSDMGDALSPEVDFEYLESEIRANVTSASGGQHLWLWLTKHPNRMAEFGRWLGDRGQAWPDNLVAMTTVTGPATVWRAEALLKVPSRFKGLSVEPLWDRVELPLVGVDWCIVGGQSGDGAKPFDLAWALDLERQCERAGTSFFLKQLGSNAWMNGRRLTLRHGHGGDWIDWPPEFRVRRMPSGFYAYRCEKLWPQPVPAGNSS